MTNLSTTLTRTTGVGTPISPGVFVVHSAAEFPLFNMGDSDRGVGLRQIAESGNVMPLLSSLSGRVPAERLGSFTLPEGATQAGAARPGSAYTFQVSNVPCSMSWGSRVWWISAALRSIPRQSEHQKGGPHGQEPDGHSEGG